MKILYYNVYCQFSHIWSLVFNPSPQTSNVAIFTNLSGNSPNFLSRGLDLIQFIPFPQRHRRRFQYNVNLPTYFFPHLNIRKEFFCKRNITNKHLLGKVFVTLSTNFLSGNYDSSALWLNIFDWQRNKWSGRKRRRSCAVQCAKGLQHPGYFPVAQNFGITPVSKLHKA